MASVFTRNAELMLKLGCLVIRDFRLSILDSETSLVFQIEIWAH
jgi:hypothetical protein